MKEENTGDVAVYVADEQELEMSRLRQEYEDLAARRKQLEATLSDRLDLLRAVCLEESVIQSDLFKES